MAQTGTPARQFQVPIRVRTAIGPMDHDQGHEAQERDQAKLGHIQQVVC